MKGAKMKILLAGGGSGGHVTPLKAIVDQLKTSDEGHTFTLVTNREFNQTAHKIFADAQDVCIRPIFAGKWRRYHSKSALWHLLHIPTLFKNIRDVGYLLIGTVQAFWILLVVRPDVVFCKGGFVCVPVGLATRLLRKRLVIHDSDARPGLTNRLLSQWADTIATGMPTDFYPYDKKRMIYTGIPVSQAFHPVSQSEQQTYKVQLGFKANQPVLLITGGGNGADSLNKKISGGVGELLHQGWGVVHLAGRGKSTVLLKQQKALPVKLRKQWHIEEFADMVPRMLAADVVMARTSASTLQECANAHRVVIGVPSPHLDDQKMNADYFAEHGAIISADQEHESGSSLLQLAVDLYGTKQMETLSKKLSSLYENRDAAAQLAGIITTNPTD